MSNALPPQTHLRTMNPRGYIQRGRETFSPEARQMLFRFMVDSREETAQDHGASQPSPQNAEGFRLEHQSPKGAEGSRLERPVIVEDNSYLAGYHREPL